MPGIDLRLIQQMRNQRRRRRHWILGSIIVMVMFAIGISLVVLGFKFHIEDVWLLGAIFLGLVVLLFTVSSIAIAIPTYTTYRAKKKEEKERLKRERNFKFPNVHYEKIETTPENGDLKIVSRIIQTIHNGEEKEEREEKESCENNADSSCIENVEVDIKSRTSSSSSLHTNGSTKL